ncbi:hypothetical protein ABKA04_005825 [Annulohypoxylon sp. FPYF3050]
MDPSNSPAHLNRAEQDLQQDLQPSFNINVTTEGTKVAQSKPTEQDKPGVKPIMVHMNPNGRKDLKRCSPPAKSPSHNNSDECRDNFKPHNELVKHASTNTCNELSAMPLQNANQTTINLSRKEYGELTHLLYTLRKDVKRIRSGLDNLSEKISQSRDDLEK